MTRRMKNIILVLLIALVCALIATVVVNYVRLVAQQRQHARDLAEYPVYYDDVISRYASEYDLDPYLVLSIMRCESSFQEDAVSPAGAIGLMQIMPDSGGWIAHKLDEEPFELNVLYDPETNIRFACWFIRFLNDRFDGNRTNMIAAYNAGHGNVENWLDDPAYSAKGTLTNIPYEETARYLEKINKAYGMYQTLYPELFGTVAEKSTP